VLIDFTRPEARSRTWRSVPRARRACRHRHHRLHARGKAEIGAFAKDLPDRLRPTSSVGVNVVLRLLRLVAQTLGDG